MRPGIILGVCLAVLAVVAVLMWRGWAQDRAAREALEQQGQQLRAQLEERDRTITELKGKLRQLRSLPGISSAAGDDERLSGPMGVELELSRRLAALTVLQSNLLALVERVTARVTAMDSAEAIPKGGQAVVGVLEYYLAQYQQQAEEARQKAASLLMTLNVPAEIAATEVKTALDTASFSLYWPYF